MFPQYQSHSAEYTYSKTDQHGGVHAYLNSKQACRVKGGECVDLTNCDLTLNVYKDKCNYDQVCCISRRTICSKLYGYCTSSESTCVNAGTLLGYHSMVVYSWLNCNNTERCCHPVIVPKGFKQHGSFGNYGSALHGHGLSNGVGHGYGAGSHGGGHGSGHGGNSHSNQHSRYGSTHERGYGRKQSTGYGPRRNRYGRRTRTYKTGNSHKRDTGSKDIYKREKPYEHKQTHKYKEDQHSHYDDKEYAEYKHRASHSDNAYQHRDSYSGTENQHKDAHRKKQTKHSEHNVALRGYDEQHASYGQKHSSHGKHEDSRYEQTAYEHDAYDGHEMNNDDNRDRYHQRDHYDNRYGYDAHEKEMSHGTSHEYDGSHHNDHAEREYMYNDEPDHHSGGGKGYLSQGGAGMAFYDEHAPRRQQDKHDAYGPMNKNEFNRYINEMNNVYGTFHNEHAQNSDKLTHRGQSASAYKPGHELTHDNRPRSQNYVKSSILIDQLFPEN